MVYRLNYILIESEIHLKNSIFLTEYCNVINILTSEYELLDIFQLTANFRKFIIRITPSKTNVSSRINMRGQNNSAYTRVSIFIHMNKHKYMYTYIYNFTYNIWIRHKGLGSYCGLCFIWFHTSIKDSHVEEKGHHVVNHRVSHSRGKQVKHGSIITPNFPCFSRYGLYYGHYLDKTQTSPSSASYVVLALNILEE